MCRNYNMIGITFALFNGALDCVPWKQTINLFQDELNLEGLLGSSLRRHTCEKMESVLGREELVYNVVGAEPSASPRIWWILLPAAGIHSEERQRGICLVEENSPRCVLELPV